MIRRLFVLILLFASVATMADDRANTVSVTGTGTVSALPDRATVQMSIVSRAKELDVAQAAAAKVTTAILALTDRLDIERNKVDTTGATVRPDYRWNRETEEQELRGYIAERQMHVRVDDLDRLGKLVEGAVAAGVNQVSPPQLDSSRREALHREALAMAAGDARANAEVLAKALGAKLGDPISIADGSVIPGPPVPQVRMATAAMESDSAATYSAGDLTFTARVSAVFELVN
ncbi:MAG: SIMPL domain-containing protein [Gammaproteobacteria bacterium]|nr:SIMPL domain-containing protein [Gammaproteobacteria bacterium]MBT8109210.1 SIMPL domain-containing protein [Gammaproteobacteria bacterium]NND48490.1 SIMPL domain-containing protein [Woeseiaceae bacterium]NNL43912.1 SIMPL domain-containing protein [Woeseiaceae bacterium]